MAEENKQAFSAVMITLNEAENLARSLPLIQQVTDDIIIADSGSTDNTASIAALYGASVHQVSWQGYARTKNMANQLARNEWILSLDADEVLSEELIQSLQNLRVSDDEVYLLDRLTSYCGQWVRHSGWYPDWKPRLFQRGRVEWEGDFVHETLVAPAAFRRVRLKGRLLHYSYNSLKDHDQRNQKYAKLAAQQLFQQNKKASWTKRRLSPLFRFIKTYFIKLGFLDGKAGWHISIRDARLAKTKYGLLAAMYEEGN